MTTDFEFKLAKAISSHDGVDEVGGQIMAGNLVRLGLIADPAELALLRIYHQQEVEMADMLASQRDAKIDLVELVELQREWSENTFGGGKRTAGVLDHIRKELNEIEAEPDDVEEWIDVVILALDGAWRTGASPQEVVDTLLMKYRKNRERTWPDWREFGEDQAIEHTEVEA